MLFSLQTSTKLKITFQGETTVKGKFLRKEGKRRGKRESNRECGKIIEKNAIMIYENCLCSSTSESLSRYVKINGNNSNMTMWKHSLIALQHCSIGMGIH